jgi:phage N-6-adenine-methyltransferase
MLTKGLFTSNTVEWSTPQYVFDWLNKEFKFQIDVCATKENTKCSRFFTKKENGLKQKWAPYTCFMNPPYGREIDKWMKKALMESQIGATVVCLVHSRTDTKWFHEYAMKSDEIWLIKGRLKFGDGKNSAPFPSCVVIFRSIFDRKNIYNNPTIQSVKPTKQIESLF